MGSQWENVSRLVPPPGGRCADAMLAGWTGTEQVNPNTSLGGEDRVTAAARGDALFGLTLCRGIPISLYLVL